MIWLILKLYMVSVFFFSESKQLTQVDENCVGQQVVILAADSVNFTSSKNPCTYHFWTKDDLPVMAVFTGIENKEIDVFPGIRVFEGATTSESMRIRLDSSSQMYHDTAIASKGSQLTISFLQKISNSLNLTVVPIDCNRFVSGYVELPYVSVPSGDLYPKNILCTYSIEPFLGSTIRLSFRNVNISNDKIKINVDGNQANTLEGSTGITEVTYEVTGKNISIVFDSVNGFLPSDRGKGFSVQYKVCTMEVNETLNDSGGKIELPLSPFNESRCSVVLTAGQHRLPVLTLSNLTKENITDFHTIEIFSGPTEQPIVLTKFANLPEDGIETYASSTEQIIVVLNNTYEGTDSPLKVYGNYSWINKDCSYDDLIGRIGDVSSTRYVGKYANNFNCTYTIFSNSSDHVIVFFNDIALASPNCRDNVQVTNEFNSENYTICRSDNNNPIPYAAPSNKINLLFKTDTDTTDRGFTATWSVCGRTYGTPYGSLTRKPDNVTATYETNCSYVVGNSESANLVILLDENTMGDTECIWTEESSTNTGEPICVNNNNKAMQLSQGVTIILYQPFLNTTFTVYWTDCGGIYDASNGSIMIPDISTTQKKDCFAIIKRENTVKRLVFLKNGTQDDCSLDIGSSLATAACMGNSITIDGNFAVVRWKSNVTAQFSVLWTETPVIYQDKAGDIRSLGYPSSCPQNSTIVYKIELGRDGEKMLVNFVYFNVGEVANNNCINGQVLITFTSNRTQKIANETLCGEKTDYSMESLGDVTLTLKTGSHAFKGFHLRYKISESPEENIKEQETAGFWTTTTIAAISSVAAFLVIVIIVCAVICVRQRSKSSKDESPVIDGKENPTFDRNAGDVKLEPVYADQPDGVYDKLRESRDKKGKKVHDDVTYSAGDSRSDPTYDKAGETREELVPYDVTYSDGKRASMNKIAQEGKPHSNKRESNGDAVNKPPEMEIEDNVDGIERNDKQYTMVHKRFDSTKKSTSEGANGAGEMSKM